MSSLREGGISGVFCGNMRGGDIPPRLKNIGGSHMWFHIFVKRGGTPPKTALREECFTQAGPTGGNKKVPSTVAKNPSGLSTTFDLLPHPRFRTFNLNPVIDTRFTI